MAFAPSKGKFYGQGRQAKQKLDLSAMMDMMTIILLFLIKSYSATGALLVPSQHLELPDAKRDLEPKKTVSILVTKTVALNETQFTTERAGVLEDITEGGEIRNLATTAELDAIGVGTEILPTLKAYLDSKRNFRLENGLEFKGEITIQCGKDIPYNWLLKVINTCGQAEFATIDFVIKKIE